MIACSVLNAQRDKPRTGHLEAVQYARAHLCRFYGTHGTEVDRLMGCTLYRGRLHASPYADLLSPALWDEFALEFARQCCSLVGQVWLATDIAMSTTTLMLCMTMDTRRISAHVHATHPVRSRVIAPCW